MCFIEKNNCIRIRKKYDSVPDPVRTLGQVWYWGASSSQFMCSITTLCSLTCSLMAKYFMSMYLLRLPLLSFLARKTGVELSQYNLSGLWMELIILRPTMKLLSQPPCEVASKQETNSTSIVEVVVKVCFMLL